MRSRRSWCISPPGFRNSSLRGTQMNLNATEARRVQELAPGGIDSSGYEGYYSKGMAEGAKVDAKLIAYLQNQVRFWRQRSQETEAQLDIWLSALKSAQQQLAIQPKPPKSMGVRTLRRGKTAYVRRLIQHAGAEGISPSEIRQHATADKVSLQSNFPYTILAKLKNSGVIRESAGRYYEQSAFPKETTHGVTRED
jgi:hypothetical protein